MRTSSLCMAFLMDPIETIDVEGDTTFAFMLEAQRRGHELLYLQPQHLSVRDHQVIATAFPVRVRRPDPSELIEGGPMRHAELGTPRRVVLDESVDVLFQRKDPPVDADYVSTTQILTLCRRTLVLNRPESILIANEKLFALHYANYMAPTLVTRRIHELLEFMEDLGGEMIVKPLYGRGGEGIFHVQRGDRNLASILEQSTRFGTSLVMAQRYLPAVRQGDKRILLLEGEPLGALLRVPAEGETRANLHVGGRAERTVLDADDQKIILALKPKLRELGLFFVGIDVIGGYLTEINVTSPTGIMAVNELENCHLEREVIERVEVLCSTPNR